ncbi:MAG: response regulator transcription factor [Cellulosilyticaceae bacterium]
MYNVVIIDDESFVIKSLLGGINWQELNLEVVATFSSGVDALEFIKHHPVHIVITDIRMPGLSGLDLCHHIHQQYPSTQMIIISGYADFTYAQKAIKYNVLGYCVKPLDFEEFTLLLRKATYQLTQVQSPTIDLIDAIENDDYDLITRSLTQNGMNPNAFYTAVSIGTNPLSQLFDCTLTLKIGVGKYLYLLPQSLQKDSLDRNHLADLEIRGVGIFPQSTHVQALKSTLTQCTRMAYQFFFLGKPYVNNHPFSKNTCILLSKIQSALTSNHLGAINLLISELLAPTTLEEIDIRLALKIFNLFTTHYHVENEDLYLYNFDQLTQKYENFSDMLAAVYEMGCQELPLETLSNTYNNNFIHLLKFINQNYTKDITIREVSESLNLSPNYISQLFKKETGSTYTKYLTQLRVEKAKQLLVQSNLSINEICEQVGYNDYFYFLKIFKKYVGVSPGKYKTHIGIS